MAWCSLRSRASRCAAWSGSSSGAREPPARPAPMPGGRAVRGGGRGRGRVGRARPRGRRGRRRDGRRAHRRARRERRGRSGARAAPVAGGRLRYRRLGGCSLGGGARARRRRARARRPGLVVAASMGGPAELDLWERVWAGPAHPLARALRAFPGAAAAPAMDAVAAALGDGPDSAAALSRARAARRVRAAEAVPEARASVRQRRAARHRLRAGAARAARAPGVRGGALAAPAADLVADCLPWYRGVPRGSAGARHGERARRRARRLALDRVHRRRGRGGERVFRLFS